MSDETPLSQMAHDWAIENLSAEDYRSHRPLFIDAFRAGFKKASGLYLELVTSSDPELKEKMIALILKGDL